MVLGMSISLMDLTLGQSKSEFWRTAQFPRYRFWVYPARQVWRWMHRATCMSLIPGMEPSRNGCPTAAIQLRWCLQDCPRQVGWLWTRQVTCILPILEIKQLSTGG